MNCMGNTSVISPNMDALAEDGTLFTNGYSSTPSSTPARSGLLTGLSPLASWYARIRQGSQPIPL